MKVSWPLSAREAVIHYFQFNYFQDGLVVVLLNSISDSDTISRSTHGFDSYGIPDSENVVRIDVVGGFAIQKVTENRSYFRTIANMDIKLDVIPPSFINFVSRQLIGSGFKLYKKEVASIYRGDEDFAKVLKDPQYEQIREALYSDRTSLKKVEADGIEQTDRYDKDIEVQGVNSNDDIRKPDNEDTRKTISDQCELVGEQPTENNDHLRVEEEAHSNSNVRPLEKNFHPNKEPQCEIEEIFEEDAEKRKHFIKDQNRILEEFNIDEKKNVSIRPEVEKALNTLNKAIEFIRETKSNIEHSNLPNTTIEKPNNAEEDGKASPTSNSEKILQTDVVSTKSNKKESKETSNEPRNSIGSHSSRRSGSSSYAREANQSKVAPASPDQFIQNTGETRHVSVNSSAGLTAAPSLEKMTVEDITDITSNTTIDFINEENMISKKSKKNRLCCLHQFPKWGTSF